MPDVIDPQPPSNDLSVHATFTKTTRQEGRMDRTQDPYVTIEEWWGEPLTDGLLERIKRAPSSHLHEFIESLPRETAPVQFPVLDRGTLRPILTYARIDRFRHGDEFRYLEECAKILLYAHEVAIENPLKYLFSRNHAINHIVFSRLLRLKELADSGAAQFFTTDSRMHHPSRTHGYTTIDPEHQLTESRDIITLMQRIEESSTNLDLGGLIFGARSDVGMRLHLASIAPGRFNQLIKNDDELVMFKLAMMRASQLSVEHRSLRLRSLVNLDLPKLSGHSKSLIELRKSSEDFAEWRTAVSLALREIEELGNEDETWPMRASEILYDSLEPIRTRVSISTKKSPFLESATKGITSFAFSGVGSTAGMAAGGNLASGLIGAASGKVFEIGAEYLKAIKKRRKDRAILDLVLMFEP